MNRRNLVAGIVGLFASVRAMASPKIVPLGEEGYTYDWRDGRYTNDPRFVGLSIPYGGRDTHGVWLDGRDVMDIGISRLKTGPDGFIEYHPRPYFEESYDRWNKVWIPRSEVVNFRDDHECPIRGERFLDSDDRLAVTVEQGNVRYLPVGGFPLPRETSEAGG